MHNYIANGINECEGDDAWRATASCSRATDGSACTSENGDGGYDCWAGSEHEECTCGNGLEARETGSQLEWDGETYYEYECCQPGTEGTVGEECGDCCVDVGAIIGAIIGGIVGGICFCVCVGVGICYFAKVACFQSKGATVAPVAAVQVQPAPHAEIMQPQVMQPKVMQPQVVQPMQPQVMQPMQPQVMQPQVMQPQVLQPQVLQPQVLQPQVQRHWSTTSFAS